MSEDSDSAKKKPRIIRRIRQKTGSLPIRVAVVMASSAFLSGIAVVLWHRRSLEEMRNQPESPAEASGERHGVDDEEFI